MARMRGVTANWISTVVILKGHFSVQFTTDICVNRNLVHCPSLSVLRIRTIIDQIRIRRVSNRSDPDSALCKFRTNFFQQ
jgi:hypothetical protein